MSIGCFSECCGVVLADYPAGVHPLAALAYPALALFADPVSAATRPVAEEEVRPREYLDVIEAHAIEIFAGQGFQNLDRCDVLQQVHSNPETEVDPFHPLCSREQHLEKGNRNLES
jgi:hypothetical protein